MTTCCAFRAIRLRDTDRVGRYRYIKLILKRLSESVPSLTETEVAKQTMKEREKEARGETEFMRNEYGDVIKCRYDLVGDVAHGAPEISFG